MTQTYCRIITTIESSTFAILHKNIPVQNIMTLLVSCFPLQFAFEVQLIKRVCNSSSSLLIALSSGIDIEILEYDDLMIEIGFRGDPVSF